MVLPSGLESAFKARSYDTDKYSVGVVTVIGGSKNFISAPAIAALGARAGGAGLIKMALFAQEARISASILVPEAIFPDFGEDIALPRADVYAVGMGLGLGERADSLVERILNKESGRFILDADALSALAKRREGREGAKCVAGNDECARGCEAKEFILTPHEGEAARLLGVERAEISKDRRAAALEIAKSYGAICVLKGPHTLVAAPDSRIYENDTGSPAMSLGGMGDLLSGLIASRWAWMKDGFLASVGGVWLHGKASDELLKAHEDPSIVNTAKFIGALRAQIEISQNQQSKF
ncbi:MAG: NAD(P)H-hydrate dehydratase [Kiritimatiellae bacterium]|nr:NAD(P)H-hydrate dehydratase [Kiritimatiellia bacterium]